MTRTSGACLICSKPNVSTNFGIYSCRACSSFFKRAQQSESRYPCRQNDGKCSLRADASMCRGCRYKRCLEVGMTYDRPRKVHIKKCKIEEMASIETIISQESIPSTSRTSREDSLLARIGRDHEACMIRRRIHEQEIIKRYNLHRIPQISEEVYLANLPGALAVFNVNATELWKFFLTVFPSVKTMPYKDQREFFRVCIPQFSLLEFFGRTKRIWGGYKQYYMCSVLVCTDIESPENWIGEENAGPHREELIESNRAFMQDLMKLLAPSFENADICESEKHALFALLLCESDYPSDFADCLQSFFENIRHEILNDLHLFYKDDMKLRDYSTRLGNILSICHAFREGNVLFQSFFRTQISIFDVYAAETLLQELLI
ncbi:hypothetical protein PENTCL1PPCAC_16432 [Pristionchus entomophagus]|uniref:Nuclear receptor domain-containing protein n=1 Tax=Pristionchus entomophagus TaxID=358040 RepID=A0AAV5TIQ8_9BILA|nr:hypothetical protein PENTCL1PPCAC_16432 [Pristionchus entomophagus]